MTKKREFPLAQVYGLLEPGPVVLVSTARAGRANLMPMSWHTMMEFVPPLVGCVISRLHNQALRHRIAVLVPQMAVCFRDENPAVAMPLPRGDGLEIHAQLNRPRDEATAERARREMRKPEAFASGSERLFGVSDLEHVLSLLNPPLRFHVSQEGQKLGENWNGIASIRFQPIKRDSLGRKINVPAHQFGTLELEC